MRQAQFNFHGSLNDFLPPRLKNTWIHYSFGNIPSVKDAIEALGIPHTEIETITANDTLISFSYLLQNGARIEVHPFIQVPDAPQRFILDVHLGKLARLLRLLGFDTLYANDYTDKAIVEAVKPGERIVLTRDIGLLKHKAIHWGYWLRSQQPYDQLKEVLYRFRLTDKIQPFTRCLACNGCIDPVNKPAIQHLLLPNTRQLFTEFYQCRSCQRIYWKGSHYNRMLRWVENLKIT